ncbi:MAG: hypothetical protein SCH66_09655 [Methanolobus sp.]|nr:hypothetical protein [Methanolobus sp.]
MNCHYVRRQIIEAITDGIVLKEINVSGLEGSVRAKQLGIGEVPAITINGELTFIGRVEKEEIREELVNYFGLEKPHKNSIIQEGILTES